MRLPTPLSRLNPIGYKNQFGHVLVLAGSRTMLGAAALCGLAALRTGSGLVTIGVPESLNDVLQSKVSNEIMTLPLKEVSGNVSFRAFKQLGCLFSKFQSIAIGPGLGQMDTTAKFIQKMVQYCPLPMVVDADALNAVAPATKILIQAEGPRILTPHPGEMARLIGVSKNSVEHDREKMASHFARRNNCVLLLKGHQTVVASPSGKVYINKTGNNGMATAGSGDVLTGMIAALLAQGVEPFEAAKTACYLHGFAGDAAAKEKGKVSMIASDIIRSIILLKEGKC
jgi:NAD(P)H-hydrate epimerase